MDMNKPIPTVVLFKGSESIVVNESDADSMAKDGWKPKDEPKTQPIAKSASEVKATK